MKQITARISGVQAYAAGLVRVKFFIGHDDLVDLGVKDAKEPGELTTAVVQSFDWDSWVASEAAPKSFGRVTFEADGAQRVHLPATADKDAQDWIEFMGFVPVSSTGLAPMPKFADLPKRERAEKKTGVKGF